MAKDDSLPIRRFVGERALGLRPGSSISSSAKAYEIVLKPGVLRLLSIELIRVLLFLLIR